MKITSEWLTAIATRRPDLDDEYTVSASRPTGARIQSEKARPAVRLDASGLLNHTTNHPLGFNNKRRDSVNVQVEWQA